MRDGPPGGGPWVSQTIWYPLRPARRHGPFLTIAAQFLGRLGAFILMTYWVWFLLIPIVADAERVPRAWAIHTGIPLLDPPNLLSIPLGLALMWIGAWPLWIPILLGVSLWAGMGLRFEEGSPRYHALGELLLVAAISVILTWLVVDLWWARRRGDPPRLRSCFAPRGRSRAGIACLLLAGLCMSAIRVALPYRLGIPVSAPVAVWIPALLLWVGLACLTWTMIPRRVLPRRADVIEQVATEMAYTRPSTTPTTAAAPSVVPSHTTSPARGGDVGDQTRTDVSRPPTPTAPPIVVTPSVLTPAHLSDLVLPESTRAEIRALVRVIAEPEAARAAGVEPPQGAILSGPPGTGKTLVARAIAGECGRRVLAFSGAELSSKWVGESTQRIREMFRQAREAAPCVLVLDELDGIAPSRAGDPSNSVAHRDFAERITQILQELEGVGGPAPGVFVVGATNHLDAIDPAVRSRLAYHIAIPLPDEAARAEILRRHFPPRADVTPEEIARLTSGLSGRDLRELCRAAALAAFAEHAPTVGRAHFEAALARVGQDPSAHATRPAEPSRISPASFADLVLPPTVLSELRTFVRLLREPDRGRELGAEPPLGAILYGPPGTGKTLIARAIAGELGRPVLAYSGASLTSVWAREGTQLIRDVFAQARRQAPCVLFIDELEGIVPHRQLGPVGMQISQDAAQQINQFLQELEGISGAVKGICVVGATNHLEAIDPAVLSRLSYHLEVPLPDLAARAEILRRLWPPRAETTPEAVAALTEGYSGRDLRELCKLSGLIAVGDGATAVTLDHVRRAMERITPASRGGS